MVKAAGSILVLVVLVGLYLAFVHPGEQETRRRSVRVTRGDVIRVAVATGNVEVEHEVPVKSSVGGILTRLFVKQGEKVTKGAELAEVRPVRTARTFVEAERALLAARDREESAREFLEGKHLAAILTRWLMGREDLERAARQATLGRRRMEEELALIKEGRIQVEDRSLDYTIRAPVDGHVIDVVLREGGPVVPSSSYGSGSVLVVLADMDRLLFRGTVDEIDVGRLTVGMPARVRVGALPRTKLGGRISEIGLRSQRLNDAVVFEVRIELTELPSAVLRSGYSAVAEIEIARREGVLVLPERVVEYRGDKAYVRVATDSRSVEERAIETGLSDDITVEVISGLAEGDEVLELTQ